VLDAETNGLRLGPSEMVATALMPGGPIAARLRDVLERHLRATGSALVRGLFADWDAALERFRRYAVAGAGRSADPRSALESLPQVSSP